jgi:hypothetical protein
MSEKMENSCYVCLYIDTSNLVIDEKGRIDVDKSINELNIEIDVLNTHKGEGFGRYIKIDDLVSTMNYGHLYKNLPNLNPRHKKMFGLVTGDSVIVDWLESLDKKNISKVRLIKAVASWKTETLLVEIHADSSYPSPASSMEQESFLNHIIRNIRGQVSEKQIQLEASNVIIV